MSDKFLQFWSNLQAREQMTIVIGSTLVIATALFLLFSGLWEVRTSLIQERTELIEEREWMQEQVVLTEQLTNNCRESQFLALGNSELLELLASRNQLVLANFRESLINNGTTYSMSVESNDGNSILSFIHQSACQGFGLANVQINIGDSESSYSGQVEFSHEG
ncbi:MAG: type II secretion system protein GspM [Gammaproteobacteria bacterium]|jgi:hypothetical protein|nr:type II secretion system protein GspM [Gammaproteobacteria bacterium]